MAGSYPDPPGQRMALDLDGTTLVHIDSTSALYTATQTELRTLINEANDGFTHAGSNGRSGKFAFMFPEARDIVAIYFNGTDDFNAVGPSSSNWEYSTNSTTGLDGTWTAVSAITNRGPNNVSPDYRTNYTTVSLSAITGLRCNFTYGNSGNTAVHKAVHLYGNYASGANPNRLALWHPTTDTALTAVALDSGDVGRGSSGDITFRVKNLHSSLTANTITLSIDALTDGSPTIVSQYTLSSGGAFASTATISSLASGAISSVCTLRRALSSSAALGVYSFRLKAVAASFS